VKVNIVAQRNAGTDAVERRLRCEVAATTLLLNDLGLLGYSGHVSARLPGRETFLIQSVDQPRSQLGPSDLLICDLDGNTLAGPAGLKPPSEVYLHCEILRARADVDAIAHFHHDLTTTFTLVENVTLVPVKNHAVRWADGIPTHPDPSHVSDPALGRALAATLGGHSALNIRAHGQVIAAESARAVLIDSVHFVENAVALYRAAMLGRVVPLTAAEIAAFQADFDRDRHVAKLWTYYVAGGRAKGLLPADWLL
jgi:ribulose-5-phosphate 4-epimerase/fuculose-1-phosphate aldolase